MKKVISCTLMGVCALIIASMAFLVPASVEANVTATGSWEIHQDEVPLPDTARDLHFTIYQKESWVWIEGYTITVEIVPPCPGGSDFQDSSFTEHDNGQGDGKTHAIDCVFSNGKVPYCCKVRIDATLILSGYNTVRIKDIVWTSDLPDTSDDLPDNGFTACKPDTGMDLIFNYYNDDDSRSFSLSTLYFYTDGTGYLDPDSLWGWGDWNLTSPGGSIAAGGSLSVSIPDFQFGAWLYFRATITTAGGEVEVRGEHESNGPTYVDLSSLEAIGHDGYVEVEWTTATEIDNAGFNLYHSLSKDAPNAKLNEGLIPAQGDELQGATYSFTDYDVTSGVTYYYWLEDVDLHGNSTLHGPVSATPTSVEDRQEAPIPTAYSLAQNYPNPFNATTEIRYGLPVESDVSLTIYNLTGQKVKTLANEHQTVGYKVAYWDGRNENGLEVSSGIYFYRLQAGSYTEIKKMVLLK